MQHIDGSDQTEYAKWLNETYDLQAALAHQILRLPDSHQRQNALDKLREVAFWTDEAMP